MNRSRVVGSRTFLLSLHLPRSASLVDPISLFALSRTFHQQHRHGKQRRNRPPQAESNFPDQLGDSGALAKPLEQAPHIRRTGDAKNPPNGASQPQGAALRFALAQFLGAKAHTELGAAGESVWQADCRSAQQPQRAVCLTRMLGAKLAFFHVRAQPIAVGLRYSFHAPLRDELQGALVTIFVMYSPPP